MIKVLFWYAIVIAIAHGALRFLPDMNTNQVAVYITIVAIANIIGYIEGSLIKI